MMITGNATIVKGMIQTYGSNTKLQPQRPQCKIIALHVLRSEDKQTKLSGVMPLTAPEGGPY